MNTELLSSVFLSLLLLSHSSAHSDSGSNGNGPLFGNVMRYFGETETGYGLPSSGLFDDVDNSLPQQQVSMCLPNFEVSIGSIIRTKDSQTLGAHYLNETDLGAKSRDECLRLCCKVPKCNVAVFEEKNSGSCYLFDCGSLEDFRCKFTSQSHYVSAILRRRDNSPQHNNNNSPEHSSSNAGGSIMGAHINGHSHNQHEDELSQLRGSDKTPAPAMAVVAAPALDGNKSKQTGEITHASSSTTSSSTPSPAALSSINSGSPRCSRWQFECKSSGECIAIYNVCDQIPNCPDGSDEGPELHCPASNAYSTGVGDASVNPKKQKELSPSSMNQQEHKSSQQQMHHPQPPVPINGGMEKLTLNGNGPGGLPSGNGIKSQVPLRQQEEYPISKQQPMTDGRGGIVVPRKNEQPSKIFSHTDGGIMDEAFGNHQQQPAMHNYNPFWKQSPNYDYANAELQPGNNFGPLPAPPQYPNGGVQYGNGQNYGNAGYQYRGYSNMQGSPQQSPPQGIPMVPQGQPQYPSVNNNNNYNLPSNSHQQQQIYYNSNPSQGISNNAGSPISNPVNAQPSNIQNGGTSQASNAMIPSNPQGAPQPTTSKPNTNQQGAQPNSNNNSNSSNGKNSLSKLESEFIKSLKVQSLQGGSSDIQSEELSPHSAGAGAVFIFILGLGMSIIMVIIVGCRLRRVGRRQRGKNRLDPDYLVDGMYL